jgi:hypothetical protein
MACRLFRFIARVLFHVRSEATEKSGYHLCMALSWLLAIANRLDLKLKEEIPLHCSVSTSPETTLAELQRIFSDRHRDTALEKASLCVAQKAMGIASALEYFRETHRDDYFVALSKKVAETFEAICVLAGLLGIELHNELLIHFARGCCKCKGTPCSCGFRDDRVV